MTNIRQDLIDFYRRNGLSNPDENGVLDMFVTVDGSYQRRGHESTFCITFINCVWTGRPIDFEVCLKCFKCQTCERSDTICPKGLYHGPSGSMEVANALKLFKRSVDRFGLRYLHYVADGDAKILKHLQIAKPYPGKKIEKHECSVHLGKRAYKALAKFGKGWTLAKGVAYKRKQLSAKSGKSQQKGQGSSTTAKKKGGRGQNPYLERGGR